MVGRLLCCVALLALCGCSTTEIVREQPACAALAQALLAHMRGMQIQMVEGSWKDEAFVAECVLKGEGERFTAVLLAPQMRLATLTVEAPHTLRWERAPQLPAALDPEYVLNDLALVCLPTAALAEALGEAFRVDETPDGKRRRVIDVAHNRLLSVRQLLPDGGIYFRNAQFGYEFTVRTLSQ